MSSIFRAALITVVAPLSLPLSSSTALAQEQVTPPAAESPVAEDADLRQPHADPASSGPAPQPLPHSPEDASGQKSEQMHRLDVGVTLGFNNPGGIYGGEADFRLVDRFSVGLAAGQGAWGLRITPQVRLYPFRITNAGLFLESGLSLNLGGKATTTVNGSVVQEADMALTPVANVSLGYRFSPYSWGWSALRVGYGFRLKGDNYTLRDDSILDPLMETLLAASQPGGFLIGVSGGFSAL
jgi:hypothetical protein